NHHRYQRRRERWHRQNRRSFRRENLPRILERIWRAETVGDGKMHATLDFELGRRRSRLGGTACRDPKKFFRAGMAPAIFRVQFSALHFLLRMLDSPWRLVSR